MIPFQIRYATLADVPALRQLITESARRLNAADYSPEQIESALRYIVGVDTQLIEDGTYFIAEANGRLVGGGGWSKRKTLYGGDKAKPAPDDDSLLNPQTAPAKMRSFFVHHQFARRGIGRTLLSVSEFAAREADFTRLELMATLTGEPLYAACGYEVVERVVVTMPDNTPFPAARMMKMVEPLPMAKAVSQAAHPRSKVSL